MLEKSQASGSGRPGATSPETLGAIRVPVLLLRGARTSRWFSESVAHVAGQLPDATTRQISGAAHFGPVTHARAVADEMIRFFSRIHATTGSRPATGREPV